MFLLAHLNSAPSTTQFAPGNSSGGNSVIVVLAIAVGVIVLVSFLGGAEPVVVVVQRNPGSVIGWILIAVVAAIILFSIIGSGSGSA